MGYPLPEFIVVPKELRHEGQRTVPLLHPIRHGETELTELELAPMRGSHVRKVEHEWKSYGDLLQLAGEFSGLPDSVLDQLRGADIGNVQRAVFEQCWPIRDLPAQWEALGEDLARQGLPSAMPAIPKLEGGYTLELLEPVTVGVDTASRLTFAEVTGKIARQLPLGGLRLADTPRMLELLTGASAGIVNRLSGTDLNRALALTQVFFFATRQSPSDGGSISSSPSASAGLPT